MFVPFLFCLTGALPCGLLFFLQMSSIEGETKSV